MATTTNPTYSDPEAIALAACYRLLLQKAREQREQLAETAVTQIQIANDQCNEHGQNKELIGES